MTFYKLEHEPLCTDFGIAYYKEGHVYTGRPKQPANNFIKANSIHILLLYNTIHSLNNNVKVQNHLSIG